MLLKLEFNIAPTSHIIENAFDEILILFKYWLGIKNIGNKSRSMSRQH